MAATTLSSDDDGRTISLGLGESLVIRLAENATTGYIWNVRAGADDVLRLVDDRFDLASDHAVGGAGIRILEFRAVSAGTTALHLVNAQPWAPAEASDEFNVRVAVTP